jgi:hypothetical protein
MRIAIPFVGLLVWLVGCVSSAPQTNLPGNFVAIAPVDIQSQNGRIKVLSSQYPQYETRIREVTVLQDTYSNAEYLVVSGRDGALSVVQLPIAKAETLGGSP